MKKNCVFCKEISGSKETNFAKRYPEITGRIIAETDFLVAFPCIGQLTENHFLIVTKKHYCTFCQAIYKVNNLFDEVDFILNEVHKKLGIELANSIIFEHGSLNSSMGGCGIYHAHIHVLPTIKSINPLDVFNFDNKTANDSLLAALSSLSVEDSYVLVGNSENGFYTSRLKEPLASQTLRKNIAGLLNLNDWDWRNTFRENTLPKMLEEMK